VVVGWNQHDIDTVFVKDGSPQITNRVAKSTGAGSHAPADRTGKSESSGTVFPTSQPACQCIMDKVSPSVQRQFSVYPLPISLHGFFA
jgi:hypothetical protein